MPPLAPPWLRPWMGTMGLFEFLGISEPLEPDL